LNGPFRLYEKAIMTPLSPRKLSRVRYAAALTIGAYPVITGLLYGLGPIIAEWPIWEKTLAIAPLMVPLMVWGVIPLTHFWFHRLIHVPERGR
jgi:antibiotic biosynthesis monooxygenase (ABM) superfamily enzyme